jgi:bifunctional DNase/RNase
MALAVRVQAPIFVSESVMERAGVTPEQEIDLDALTPEEEEKLEPYRDFIEGLDLGDLDE